MKGEIAKEQVRKYFVIFFFSFFCGILSDYFIINKYFFNTQEDCPQGSETVNTEPLMISSTEEDKKVIIERTCKVHVDTSGAVKQPGVFCLPEGSMVIDAIGKAGGFTNTAAYRFISRRINLSQLLLDNQKIYIPFEDEMECKLVSFLPQTKEVQAMISNSIALTYPTSELDSTETETGGDSAGCVNINTATAEELDSLSGIGEVMAKKIIEGRPYEKIEDLLNVSGIGESLFEKIKEEICI